MGFFSSRRAEHLETNLPDNAVVRVIRSRFYGLKGKGKEREIDGDSTSYSASSPSLSSPHIPSREKQSFTPTRHAGTHTFPETRRTGTSTSSLAQHVENGGEAHGFRSSADALTITLAQRLNDLATANSEGLLSDDEYRLLRQNLFERFAGGSPIPTEAPLVPISGTGHINNDGRTSLSSAHDRRPSSQYHLQSSRASSLQSKRSVTSSVTSLLRRATTRRVASSPVEVGASDTTSVFSAGSSAERYNIVPRTLASQTSDSSSRTDRSRMQPFQSIGVGRSDNSGSSIRSITLGRKRSGSTAPPSAFPGSSLAYDSYNSQLGLTDPLPNDDEVESAKDIRHHIELVEAEGRRLLDGFNGLELSTLTRHHKRPHMRPPLPLSNPSDAMSVASMADRRSLRVGGDIDALSFKSNGSIRTTQSNGRSPSGPRKMTSATSTATLIQPKPMSRKGSVSSMSSRGRVGVGGLSSSSGHYASSSSVNLTKSSVHLPLATVAEMESPHLEHGTARGSVAGWGQPTTSGNFTVNGGDQELGDQEIRAMEAELADIRRRRAEVTTRYEARLEYLRARLKGAELREKVLRK